MLSMLFWCGLACLSCLRFLQAEAWTSRGKELTTAVEGAQSSKTVSVILEGREKLTQHLQRSVGHFHSGTAHCVPVQ